jgi:dolichol-phosphate mannosyltransferase
VALDVVAEARAVALSVVAPCFNEQSCLREFHRRTSGACRRVAGDDYEIVLVDDGSRDGTWQIIQSLSETDSHVVGVHLMRNHGHQLAATAGLCAARGQRVMLIDADLQDPPELLAGMMQRMDQGADVVYGRRTARDGESWFKKASAAGFYRLLSRLANVPIPQDTGDFRLMRRRVVDALLAMPERERFLRGMVSWIGGNQVPFDYARDARHAGRTKYSLGKMLRFGTDAVTSFSIAPLRFAVWLGLDTCAPDGAVRTRPVPARVRDTCQARVRTRSDPRGRACVALPLRKQRSADGSRLPSPPRRSQVSAP